MTNEMFELKEQHTQLQQSIVEKDQTISQREQELNAYKRKNLHGQIDKLSLKLVS